MAKPSVQGIKIIAQNKKVRRFYEIMETIEAGISLTGSEVKSLRAGQVSFKDGYVKFEKGEAFLVDVHVAPYENAGYAQHNPERIRKLLLHKREIARLMGKVEQKGLTVVPLKMYFKKGMVKVELALARGLKLFDQREELKRRAVKRDMDREMARHK
ncbi:SsrA-binding protein SmpB [Desulfonatronovibrio hydrogenovorans]|uniref:SsrA-binding protein SmpB n=1 Tax=Desulfonatronovibrio hydrogenovorans TaxID=53245 RepID=UPI00048ED8C1|nr:SsrA-binding protein SmpB [Desulfonatronovibrio hydrogenovorans]